MTRRLVESVGVVVTVAAVEGSVPREPGARMLVEVGAADRERISAALLARLALEVRAIEPGIETVEFDPQPYRPGRAFVASA